MKYLYAVLALVLVYSLYSYGRILWVAWRDVNPPIAQADRTVGTGPELRYIAAGDSTAVGEGASAVGKTYAHILADKLAEHNRVEYRNIGVVGATTEDVILEQLDQIIAFKPDIVTISVGANDRTHLAPNTRILLNYKRIINTLMDQTSAKIYLTDIPNFAGADLLPWPYIQLLEYRSSTLNPELWRLENDRVKIVNIHDFGWDQFPELSLTFAADRFHPNDLGYGNWAAAFQDRMRGN